MILVASFIPIGHVTVLLQPSTVDRLTAKYFNWQPFFFLYFLHTPFGPHEWACGLWINLFGILVSLISQLCLTRFQLNLCYPFPYAYSTSTAIFRLNPLVQQFSDLSHYLMLLQSILYTAE